MEGQYYVIRLREFEGKWRYYEYLEKADYFGCNLPREEMFCGKLMGAHLFPNIEEAKQFKSKYDYDDYFEVVNYSDVCSGKV